MPRLEKGKGANRRFYQVRFGPKSLVISEGKVGEDGEHDYQWFDNPAATKAACDALVTKAQKKGFSLIDVPQPPQRGEVQRYENGTRFWEIKLVSKSNVDITEGEIGGKPQESGYSVENEGASLAENLIAAKLADGYVRVANAKGPNKANKPVKRAKPPKGVTEAVERAKTWMNANGAGVLVKNLAKGASDAALAKTEKKLGVTIPPDLRTLWKLHDGQKEEMNGFIGSLDLVGTKRCLAVLDDVLTSVDWMLSDEEMTQDADLRKNERNRRWIPFGTRDSDHLVVHADSCRVFRVSKDAPPLAYDAKSVAAFFEDYATAMEAGEYRVEEGFGDVYLESGS